MAKPLLAQALQTRVQTTQIAGEGPETSSAKPPDEMKGPETAPSGPVIPGMPARNNDPKHSPLHPARSIRVDVGKDCAVLLYRIEPTQMKRLITKCFGRSIESCNLQQSEKARLEDFIRENVLRRAIDGLCF